MNSISMEFDNRRKVRTRYATTATLFLQGLILSNTFIVRNSIIVFLKSIVSSQIDLQIKTNLFVGWIIFQMLIA